MQTFEQDKATKKGNTDREKEGSLWYVKPLLLISINCNTLGFTNTIKPSHLGGNCRNLCNKAEKLLVVLPLPLDKMAIGYTRSSVECDMKERMSRRLINLKNLIYLTNFL